MFRWSLSLGRWFGIEFSVHFTFAFLVAYVAWEGWNMDYRHMRGMTWSVLMLLAFFFCVILHELGHTFTAQRFGVRVPRIRILPIGGMAEFDAIPRQPSREFLITIAGPAVNFVLAGLMWPFVDFPYNWDSPRIMFSGGGLLRQLFIGNLVMGCFNLIPVFPMDGGRILRALLATRLTYLNATFWAATVGKVFAAAGFLAGVYYGQTMVAVLFAFIFIVGEMEYRALRHREREEAHYREWAAQAGIPAVPPLDSPPPLSGGSPGERNH